MGVYFLFVVTKFMATFSYPKKSKKSETKTKPLLIRNAECLSERCKEEARRIIFYGLMLRAYKSMVLEW